MQMRSGSEPKVNGYLYKIDVFSSAGPDKIERI